MRTKNKNKDLCSTGATVRSIGATLPAPLAAARERQRRSRDRRRRGRVVFYVDADETAVIETLIVSGRLSGDDALQRPLVERALGAMVSDWITRWKSGHA
jgi:hypothetical protein